ncbi:MAG: hypothetical protein O7B26_08900 [Planctomycetota bacterium]|nr:hypothetical protein [Planctomycetota bacterium]
MDFLTNLWLPILLSAVFVFIASSILHMVIPFHKSDFKKLPGEDKVLEEMRAQGVQPGEYMFPCAASMKDASTPEMVEKFKKGPVGIVNVMPSGEPEMGKNLAQWFAYSILISFFTAYIAWHMRASLAEYLDVFRMTGTIAVMAYAVSNIPNSIWKGVSWRTTLKFVFDGVIYGLVTAGTFGWLWPDAAS